MQKQKENTFTTKFRLLYSQENENNEEINWSSSESSEYENAQKDIHNIITMKQSRKRKRKKALKNISNLNLKIIDTCDEKISFSSNKKSICDRQSSPILTTQHCSKGINRASTSPILSSTVINQHNGGNDLKSPILVLKTASPCSHRIRKKLFTNDPKLGKGISLINVDENDNNQTGAKLNVIQNHSMCIENIKGKKNYLFMDNIELKEETISADDVIKLELNQRSNEKEECVEKSELDDSTEMLKFNNFDNNLMKKVNSYFESYFSSESPSQYSINDTPTPKNSSKTSDDIEIFSIITQLPSNKNSSESIKEELENVNLKSKKVRYKKNGLAYHLSSLLKKHNANISLWQHEKFLAANSNFIIPKGEHLVFQIQNIQLKYGCYLLEAKNFDDESFYILINADYITDCNIYKDIIFKLYEPYKIIDLNEDFKLIINVCKFEVVTIKT